MAILLALLMLLFMLGLLVLLCCCSYWLDARLLAKNGRASCSQALTIESSKQGREEQRKGHCDHQQGVHCYVDDCARGNSWVLLLA
jgi:hypothetical protein